MKKTEILPIRISSEIKAALEQKASGFGMNISEYVRLLILEDLRSNAKREVEV